ncbi:ABC transporter permease [Sporosarcina highlanderae]|uniref:ABC transporter permease n=1 Tax=Sporosarcina highlanderae TaxID=3035916 RepID=A0ABT8JX22_9BACL|nr:ABC transporter permease [Sporosarcina highlanderae]MDN4608882.1 ABC transporter permease [Sporosarcina highlanderae]
MKSLLIAVKDAKIHLKDRKAILMMILMPILLTLILGSALKGVMGGGSMPETILGVYSPESNLMTKSIMKSLGENGLTITIEHAESEKQLMDWMEERAVHVGLLFPDGWGSGVEGNRAVIIPISGQETGATVIRRMIETVAQMSQAIENSTATVMAEAATLAAEDDINLEEIQNELTASIEQIVNEQRAYVIEPPKEESVSSMQYYAAAMAAMFLLFNAMAGGKSFHQERRSETLSRLMMTPASVRSILTGKFIGSFLFAWIQFLIFLGATRLLLKVDWGPSILQILFITFFYIFSVAGLAMVVAAFTTNEKMADVIGSMGVQVLALLGGSMLPLSLFPEIMRKIAMATPNSWALTSFISIMEGAPWSTLWLPAAVLLGIGVTAIFISSLRLGRRIA